KTGCWARPQAAQVPVGMWAKAGEPVGNTCGQAVGRRSLSTGCPSGLSTGRADGEPAGGRQAIVHISTGTGVQRAQPFGQGRSPRSARPKAAAAAAGGHDFP
ncbi:hypothetical protein DRC65_24525, partial [Salmonella enterica subsp. enterica serovar Anatum]|nr:hypothetical protein [Salmonella enterica subsp. enterica serovar Anatum]